VKRIRRPIIIKLVVVVALVLAMAALLVAHEFRTSAWQARYFAQLAKSQTFPIKPGPTYGSAITISPPFWTACARAATSSPSRPCHPRR